MFDENSTPQRGTEIKPRGFSSKRNIIIIVIAVLVVLGGIGAAVAFGVSHSASQSALSGFQLAEKYLSEQNYEQAIIAFEQILEIEPMNVDAYLGLANAHIGAGNTDNALEILRKGLELTGDARIQAKIDELTKQTESSSSASSSTNPVEIKPEFGSMGSVNIFGTELDIATTTSLLVYNKESYETEYGEYEYDTELTEQYDTVIDCREKLSADALDKIASLSQLYSLDLYYVDIADTSALSKLTQLRRLEIENCDIDDITPLAELKDLRSLFLTNTRISDIAPLVKLTDLDALSLTKNSVNDITPLTKLTNLTFLQLNEDRIKDISPITKLTNLTFLNIIGTEIQDISFVGKLPKLTELLFQNTRKISDISILADFPNLKHLDLHNNQITDITPLAGLTNLERLNLKLNPIGDITPLLGLKNLKELYLDEDQISDADMERLKAALPGCTIEEY